MEGEAQMFNLALTLHFLQKFHTVELFYFLIMIAV